MFCDRIYCTASILTAHGTTHFTDEFATMASVDRKKKIWRKDEERPSQPILDRTPPCDVPAEMAVLGSILLLPDVCDDLVMVLKADDFYDDANRKLYQHMTDMIDLGQKIDITLLVNRLKAANDYEAVGGSAYLARLANSVPNAAHAVYYAEIVRSKATFRKLIEASTSILKDAYEECFEARELLSQAEQRVFQIQDDRGGQSADNIGDLVQSAMERIDARMQGTHSEGGVDTHFTDFDAMSGGMHNGELLILAARPSMGKTAFALNIAENVTLLGGAPVLFVSLEMSGIELADRLLCSVARVNGHRLRNGTISQDDRKRLVEKAMEVSNAPLYVDDSPTRTVSEIAAVARRIVQRRPDGAPRQNAGRLAPTAARTRPGQIAGAPDRQLGARPHRHRPAHGQRPTGAPAGGASGCSRAPPRCGRPDRGAGRLWRL